MAKKETVKDSLTKELKDLIPKLDSEGLAFLVEQARIHLYNMQVVELNKAAEAANTATRRKNKLSIEQDDNPQNNTLRIEGTASGSSYYIFFRNGSVMFSKDEMVGLVKLVNADRDDLEIREALYNWLENERRDIFALLPIQDKFDQLLKDLVKLIKQNFKLRN